MIDHEDREEPFLIDGYYILRNIRSDQGVAIPLSSTLESMKQAMLAKVN
jgi:hypothetical protein